MFKRIVKKIMPPIFVDIIYYFRKKKFIGKEIILHGKMQSDTAQAMKLILF